MIIINQPILLHGPKLNNFIKALHKYHFLRMMKLNWLSLHLMLEEVHDFENQVVEISITEDKITFESAYVYGIFNIVDLKEDEPICLSTQKNLLISSRVITGNITTTGTGFFPT